MEKKVKNITVQLFLLALLSCSQSQTNNKREISEVITKSNYDTLFFANEHVSKLVIKEAKQIKNGIILPTKGKGINIWLDSLLYKSQTDNKFLLLSSTPENETLMIYYNGDSTTVEKIAINKPIVNEYKLSNSKVISIIDSSYNSGYLIKSLLFYKINGAGLLLDKKDYFCKKKGTDKKYDFIIDTRILRDTLMILKNNVVDYKYY